MATNTFTSLAELRSHLSGLPAPARGFRRVFRGQTHNYDNMLVSGIRRPTREYWSLWHRHAMLVAKFEPNLEIAERRREPSTLDMLGRWVHAIAQHYGGDSNYLDVTHDVESALWFALHEMRKAPGHIVMGRGTALDPGKDITVDLDFVTYEPWTKDPGWLYIFDVPEWTEDAKLEHGVLIDIAAQAPALIASTRMVVQRACLLYADAKQGDLQRFCRTPPLRVGWPMAESERLKLTTSDMFPPPSSDPWYKIFCDLPLGPTVTVNGKIRIDRPIPVAQYLPGNQNEIDDLLGRLFLPTPILARSAMLTAMRQGGAPRGAIKRLERAIVVLVEAALMALLASPIENGWNLSLLLGALPRQIVRRQFNGKASDSIASDNLFFEFCPLERKAIESGTGSPPPEYPRGLWMIRRCGRVAASLYMERANGSGYVLPLLHVTTGKQGDTVLRIRRESLPPELHATLLRPICAALFSLAWLGEGDKILPFPVAAIDKGHPGGTYICAVDSLPVQLKTVPTPLEGVTVHVLRQGNEVFCGPAKSDEIFTAPADREYGLIPAEHLRRCRREQRLSR